MNDLIERIKSNFPKELQDLNQWVLWRMETRDDKPTKVPYSIVTGLRAASDNPSTWASFDAVCKAYQAGGYAGIGYMFHESDPYTGIDFDKCVNDGGMDIEKLYHVDLLDSYSEISQSGTGIHVIIRAKLPAGGRKSREHLIEMYDHKRFFCVTGDILHRSPSTVNERQPQLDALYALIFPPKEPANTHANASTTPSHPEGTRIPADDQELLQIMFRSKPGAKVQALWDGNRSGYSDDDSAADLALCNYLAFFTGNDAARIDRMFRQSKLYRDKWLRSARTGETYGAGTIARAIAATVNTYQPREWADEQTTQIIDPDTGEITTLTKTRTYTNGSNGNGYHAEPVSDFDYAKGGSDMADDNEAPQAKVKRRNYLQLLGDMKAAALKIKDESFITECLYDKEEGDARLLDTIVRGSLVYDHADGLWYWYNNLFWDPDETWNVHQLISDVLSEVYKNLSLKKHAESIDLEKKIHSDDDPSQEDKDRLRQITSISKAAKGRAVSLNEIKEVKQVLSFANSGLRLGIRGHEWDTRTDLLCTQNAIVNLHTGETVAPDPMAYIRTVASVNFDKDATCPVFEKSILEIFNGDQDSVDYVQRLLGYAMAGECIESDFPIWYGEDGRNGKEFILERIRNVLGEKLTGVVESEILLASKMQRGKNSSTEGLMVLRGRRIAWASETNEGRSLDLASMKDLSGGHILTGRHNHGKQVEWKRTHTLILLTNHRPHVNSQALAEWDRVKLLEFPLSFVNEPDPAKPNQRLKDKTLGDRIDKNELSGVLNWLIAGNLAWRAIGLSEPESVKSATAQYRADEDSLGHFVKESCLVGDGFRCKPVELYRSYVNWVDVGSKPMGKKTFYNKMEQRGFRRSASQGIEYFNGIGILA